MKSYAERIYTSTGITTKNIFSNGEKVLHVGSGSRVLPGATTIDILPLPGVDVVHDLDVTPWPYEDNSFDVVYGHNVFEHLTDQLSAMSEVWRVLKPNGRVVITVPYFRSVDAFSDPTHKHFFTSKTMDAFLESDSGVASYAYTQKRFTKIGFWYGWPQPSKNPFIRVFKNFLYSHQDLYDSHLSLLFPAEIVIWELEVIKKP
ncbi:methyltransferase domain-containing protein [Patescibacteria group bacterium]|nr:methyltransferase domain-containing protein [Patescibacteria group bacterium]